MLIPPAGGTIGRSRECDVVLDDDDDIIPYLDKKYGAGAPA